MALAGTTADGSSRLPEPRMGRGRPPDRRRLHRAALHGRVLGRVQGRLPGRSPTSSRSCATTGRRSSGPAQHVGRARGQPHAGSDPRERRALPRGFLRQRDAEPRPGDHRLLLRRPDRGSPRRARGSPGRRRWSPAERPFPIVLTTNSGYPLDQNLYQTVKGMSAAAQIVRAGRLHPRRLALQRRIPRARQFPAPDDRLRRAARRSSTRSSRPASPCSTSGRRSCWR